MLKPLYMNQTKVILPILFFIISIQLFAQERYSKSIPSINQKLNSKLEKATGWSLNPEEQWIQRPNKIPFPVESQYKFEIDFGEKSVGIDNFIFFEFRDILINDTIYSILIKKFTDGYYKYELIKQDWLNQTKLNYYIFEKNELIKFSNINNNEVNSIKLKMKYFGTITSEEINNIELQILNLEPNLFKNSYLTFLIAPYKEKGIVQFFISKRNIPIELNKSYYEIDWITFNNFINL